MSPRVIAAEQRAASARARLADSLAALRDHISPASIAHRVAGDLKSKSAEALETSVDTVREHRWAFAGAATLAGLFFARKPIAAILAGDETPAAPEGSDHDTKSSPEDPT